MTGAPVSLILSVSSKSPLRSDSKAGARSCRIRELNDSFRTTLVGGKAFFTPAVSQLGRKFGKSALAAVRAFGSFSADGDPYGEHDFGAFRIGDERLCWKIDYYDPSLDYGSKDPADPAQTTRVLTIMLAEEY